jgi:putative redox protein
MAVETVRVDWVDGGTFLMQDRYGFPLVAAAPPYGVDAADLLPLALITCSIWDVNNILHKQRQKFTGLHAVAESQQDDEPPWRFRRIHVRYIVQGAGVNPQAVERAVRLSQDKYCAVFATLRDAVELTTDWVIETSQ